jgi:AraC-like DNA-binding protein
VDTRHARAASRRIAISLRSALSSPRGADADPISDLLAHAAGAPPSGGITLSTAAIAERVGYCSEASFAKAFKKELGTGLGAYRRKSAPDLVGR